MDQSKDDPKSSDAVESEGERRTASSGEDSGTYKPPKIKVHKRLKRSLNQLT